MKIVTTTEIQYLILMYDDQPERPSAICGLFADYEQATSAVEVLQQDYFYCQFSITPLEVGKVEVSEFSPEPKCECLGCDSNTRCMRTVIGYCGGCGVYHGNEDDDLCGRCKI
jgi:hypothetical protein